MDSLSEPKNSVGNEFRVDLIFQCLGLTIFSRISGGQTEVFKTLIKEPLDPLDFACPRQELN